MRIWETLIPNVIDLGRFTFPSFALGSAPYCFTISPLGRAFFVFTILNKTTMLTSGPLLCCGFAIMNTHCVLRCLIFWYVGFLVTVPQVTHSSLKNNCRHTKRFRLALYSMVKYFRAIHLQSSSLFSSLLLSLLPYCCCLVISKPSLCCIATPRLPKGKNFVFYEQLWCCYMGY